MAYQFSRLVKILMALAVAAILSSCQSEKPTQSAPNLSLSAPTSPAQTIAAIARTAQTCWFKSKDPVFRKFKLANEVNSYAGRPRFLLVPHNKPSGLPQLVVQAERSGKTATGKYTRVESFGPLLQTANGKRISDDVKRWSSGSKKCSA